MHPQLMLPASHMLPTELVLSVLEHIYYTYKGDVDYTTLRSCSLVCRTWYAAVQPLLLRHVGLHSTVPTQLVPNGNNVLVLDVKVGKRKAISPSVFAKVFVSCRYIYELSIQAKGLNAFDRKVMRILSASPPQFRALRIKGVDELSTIPYQLLSLTSSVCHLSIHSLLWSTEPPSSPMKHRLYELTTRSVICSDIMLWFLSASVGTLQLLGIGHPCPPSVMQIIAKTHGPYIRSIYLQSYVYPTTGDFLAHFTNLEELVFLAIPDGIQQPNRLPVTITHLAFRIGEDASSSSSYLWPIFDAIEALPNLRLVSCEKHAATHLSFPELQAICAKRNVDIVCHPHDFTMLEEMIPGKRFPRLKSISNFGLMR